MAKRFQLIVFDWDGTLLNSTATIAQSVQAAARDLGLPVPSDERARHIIGLGLLDAMRHAMPDLPESRYPEVADRYRHHYLSKDHELSLFAGAAELVNSLAEAGYLLAVATGKSRKGLDRAFAVSGLGERFHASRCADECHSKPHPQMLEELIDELGVDAGATLMIGDTTHDLLMAKNAGVAAIGVTYGAHPREALLTLDPRYCADTVEQLAVWLQENA
jgi:phosphoglycolate phosphatase